MQATKSWKKNLLLNHLTHIHDTFSTDALAPSFQNVFSITTHPPLDAMDKFTPRCEL